mgnify:CR=1 FL=1
MKRIKKVKAVCLVIMLAFCVLAGKTAGILGLNNDLFWLESGAFSKDFHS